MSLGYCQLLDFTRAAVATCRKCPVSEFAFLTPLHVSGTPLGSLRGSALRLIGASSDATITNVAVNGGEMRPHGLFAALPGRHGHGAQYAEQAIAAGAVAVLTDQAGLDLLPDMALPVLVADDPRAVLGEVAARVYGTNLRHPQLFGVTGTNGKTSTVHLLDALLEQLGIPAGHSSTADRRSGPTTVASRLTSPEAPEMHALLARMNEDGVEAAALEVSAQALRNSRVDGALFDVAGFTNLSHDHMDEFGSMSAYLDAKLALFTPARARRGVVLLDSPAGAEIRDRAEVPITTITSHPGITADWTVEVHDITAAHTRFTLTGPDRRRLTTTIPLIGRHMAADAGLAVVMLVEGGIAFERIAEAIAGGVRVSIPGRMTQVSGADGPLVYTDFSHTPDSIAKSLEALRQVTPGQLIVIIGADGEKDHTKREPMGLAAARGADVVIVNDHHQRFEDPAAIRNALLAGARQSANDRILDVPIPSQAIRTAIGMASTGDTILWVGPGLSDHRIVRGENTPYAPFRDARLALTEAGWH
jgi:UDP-N-acetylmuramoyl-L-alanyl-D-glutamate--2,6-diaminopimelate ligase